MIVTKITTAEGTVIYENVHTPTKAIPVDWGAGTAYARINSPRPKPETEHKGDA